MKRRDFDIDHIDPRWEDGRDYQLVCGLDCLLNYREEDPSKNSAKSNRFLPWRWSRDEIGVVPEEYGDLAQFLVNGEWVLLEFLSEEWFQASIGTCSRSHRKIDFQPLQEGLKRSREQNPEVWLNLDEQFANRGRDWIEKNKKLHTQLAAQGRREFCAQNPEWEKQRTGKVVEGFKDWYDNLSEEQLQERAQTGKKVASWRYQCTVTGHISNAPALARWQRKRGIDPSNRIRLQ